MLFNRPMLKLTAVKVGCYIWKSRGFKLHFYERETFFYEIANGYQLYGFVLSLAVTNFLLLFVNKRSQLFCFLNKFKLWVDIYIYLSIFGMWWVLNEATNVLLLYFQSSVVFPAKPIIFLCCTSFIYWIYLHI